MICDTDYALQLPIERHILYTEKEIIISLWKFFDFGMTSFLSFREHSESYFERGQEISKKGEELSIV